MLHVQVMKLRRLKPETWGDRVRRARHEAGRPSLDRVAAVLSRYGPVDKATLSRMERLTEPPHDRPRRARAALVLLAYGFDLTDFGLSADDVPPGIDRDAFLKDTAALIRTIGGYFVSQSAA